MAVARRLARRSNAAARRAGAGACGATWRGGGRGGQVLTLLLCCLSLPAPFVNGPLGGLAVRFGACCGPAGSTRGRYTTGSARLGAACATAVLAKWATGTWTHAAVAFAATRCVCAHGLGPGRGGRAAPHRSAPAAGFRACQTHVFSCLACDAANARWPTGWCADTGARRGLKLTPHLSPFFSYFFPAVPSSRHPSPLPPPPTATNTSGGATSRDVLLSVRPVAAALVFATGSRGTSAYTCRQWSRRGESARRGCRAGPVATASRFGRRGGGRGGGGRLSRQPAVIHREAPHQNDPRSDPPRRAVGGWR